eukprot:gnl/MRDRNA2_/MRDRNA2_103947_c0_seq1.p1 gnl/MRDRNA2_/MRDRNA2_103947_c0~~gnl/MRDRNA2_/MRDRNA2_103947_c0_seq1.p1  ORF type:complete len:295 (+),score=59.95 gnl/MRDRNA2_/MRDRNA2_103947_c0_seq1:92-976(+)
MSQKPSGADAYAGKQSSSTRNPHTATASVELDKLRRMEPEERVLAQWKAACGSPISDEAKTQFAVTVKGRQFLIGDIRLWSHQNQNITNRSSIHLEFFYDGSQSDLGDSGAEEFSQAFEAMVEEQLRERRVAEFRRKLQATNRRRAPRKAEDSDALEGGGNSEGMGEDEWKLYLKQPIPSADVAVRSYRDAGCMISFLVVQTSISISAAEGLGQVAFPEHFPIDGKIQDVPESTMQRPRWMASLVLCTIIMVICTLFAWYQVAMQIMVSEPTRNSALAPEAVGDALAVGVGTTA